MIDFVNCRALLSPSEVAIALLSAAFEQWDGSLDKRGRAVVHGFRGLTWSLHYDSGRLRISGALPTFANGHNAQLLSIAEADLAIVALAAMVGLPADRLEVKGVELSIDMKLPSSPRPFLESLVHHQQSKFYPVSPPNGVARPMEYVATLADYRVKPYDKGAYLAYQGNPLPPGEHKLRYEVAFTRSRLIKAMLNQAQVTLADLATPGFYRAAAAELCKQWQLTVRKPPLNFTGLKWQDSALLNSGASPDFWRGLKEAKMPLATFNRKKARWKQLAAAAQERTGLDVYNQQFMIELANMLATVPATENDNILQSCNHLESPPVKEPTAAPPLVKDVGLLARSLACLAAADDEADDNDDYEADDNDDYDDDHDETGARRWPVLRNSSPGPHGDDDEREPTTTAARYCLTCSAPIASHRKPETRYCGKKCKNAASNPVHNTRRTVHRILSPWTLFDQRPFLHIPEPIRAAVLAATA